MKGKLSMLLAVSAMLTAFSLPASALEYQFDAPDAGLFGRPTSDETIYVSTQAAENTDRSKDAAHIPPAFGSPSSYTLGDWELLTPNLFRSNLTETVFVSSTTVTVPPAVSSPAESRPAETSYTPLTSDLLYAGGHLGTLRCPAIGLSVKIYEGTDSATLAKGAGHFAETSVWDGNVPIAGHNRGASYAFEKIHTLKTGDKITYSTKLGSRSYTVRSVEKILATSVSVLNPTRDNRLTLLTCVRNQPDYRWCVTAWAD